MYFLLRWLPAAAWGAWIFWLSHQSHPPGAELAPDYVGHFLLYAVFSSALAWGVTGCFSRRLSAWTFLVVVAGSTLYGLSDELHQSFVPLRSASAADILADFAGSAVAALAIFLLLRFKAAEPED